ncbi:MAG: hypothetical protein V3S51_07060, partial [Dehalococcoidia bacterium]
MSTDHNDLMADYLEEEPLAYLKKVEWEGIGKGKLSLTEKRIAFEGKGGLFSSSHEEVYVDISMISSAAVDEVSNTLILEWLDEGNKLMAGRLR